MRDATTPLNCSPPRANRIADWAVTSALASLVALACASCHKSVTTQPTHQAINSDSWATYADGNIVSEVSLVRSGLNSGSYSGTQVVGNEAGTATVVGTISPQSSNVTVGFGQFDDNSVFIDGTITYQESSGSFCVASTGSLSFRTLGPNPGPHVVVSDVITSLRSCGTAVLQSGSMTTSSGTFLF